MLSKKVHLSRSERESFLRNHRSGDFSRDHQNCKVQNENLKNLAIYFELFNFRFAFCSPF